MGQEISMPGSFGGLMRYKDEYNSKLKISPAQVILMIVGSKEMQSNTAILARFHKKKPKSYWKR